MANHGTQVIQEEQSEDIAPLNEEEFTEELHKILQDQQSKKVAEATDLAQDTMNHGNVDFK